MSAAETGVRAMVRAMVLRAARPPDRPPVSAFAERHRVLVARDCAEPGPWRNRRTPYLVDIMDAMGRAAGGPVRRVTIMKRERVGGTEALNNYLLWCVAHNPGATMLVYPTMSMAQEVMERRVLPMIRACPPAAAHLTERKHDVKTLGVRFDHMDLIAGWSNSEARLEAFGYRNFVIDELDRGDPELVEITIGRTKTYPGSLFVVNSTPSLEGVGVDEQYRQSSRLKLFCPCPRCGGFFVARFADCRWDGGLNAEPDVVRDTAWLACPLCGGRVEPHERPAMLAQGLWSPTPPTDEQRPEAHTTLADEPVRLAALGVAVDGGPEPAEHVGFHLGAFDDAFSANPFGEVAAEFVRNQGPTPQWVNRRLGEAWSPKGEQASESALLRVVVPATAVGGYRAGTVPVGPAYPDGGCVVLTGGVDVQQDRAYAVVRAWGPAPEGARRAGVGGLPAVARSWLVWWAKIPLTPGGNLEELDTLLGWTFPLARPVPGDLEHTVRQRYARGGPGTDRDSEGEAGGVVSMRVGAWAIDSGFRASAVYAFIQRHRERAGRTLFPVKGQGLGQMVSDAGAGNGKPFWTQHVEDWPDGRRMPHGLRLLNITGDYWKELVHTKIRPVEVSGGERAGLWALPDAEHDEPAVHGGDSMAEYLRQLTAEHRVREDLISKQKARLVRTTGRRAKHVWRLRKGRRHNHYLDCECYAAALAAHLDLHKLTAPAGLCLRAG